MSTYISSPTSSSSSSSPNEFSWPTNPPARSSSTTSSILQKDTTANLDTALQKISSAVSRLHNCGPSFKAQSEAFWIFCAGSWTRNKYEQEVRNARKKLEAKRKNLDEELRLALGEVLEAVRVLRKGLCDGRDADALIEAVETCGVWENWG